MFLQLAVRIANAVANAHERGVIRCDLKPANILVAAGNPVRSSNFGFAKRLDFGC